MIKSKAAREAADWGTLVHRWVETGRTESPSLRKAITLSMIDRESLWPKYGQHETKCAVRVDRVREGTIDRDVVEQHELLGTPEWVTGTADFHWVYPGGGHDAAVLWVDDLKTGKWYPDPADPTINRFPQDPSSAQLKLYALAISESLGYEGAVALSVTHWPRLPLARRHSPPVRIWYHTNTADLEKFWSELEALYDATRADPTPLNPGEHCRFCPSREFCLVAEPIPKPAWRHRVVAHS